MRTRLPLRKADLLALLVVLGLLATIHALTRNGPPEGRWYSGEVNQTIVTPVFDVRAEPARLTEVATGTFGDLTRDAGVLVVIDWSLSCKKLYSCTTDAYLVTVDGLRYRERSEFTMGHTPVPEGVGFTAHGSSVFELPTDALAGAVLEISQSPEPLTTTLAHVRVAGVVDPDAPVLGSIRLEPSYSEVTP